MFKSLPSFLLSLLIHAALLALVIFGYDWQLEPQQRFSDKPVKIVKAVVIDDGRLQAEMKKLQEEVNRKQLEEEQHKVELKRQADLAEEKRIAEENRLIELEQKQKEEKRLAEEKIKQDAEAKRLAEAKKIEEAVEAKKAAEEKKQLEQKKKKEAEKKRLAEEIKRKKEAVETETKRKAEEEAKAKLDAESQRERMAEKRRLETLLDEYKTMIAQKVERYWRRPPNVAQDLSCTVKVRQIPGGEVISATVDVCNGDAVVQRSIETAVERASPLPVPSDPALFDRNLEFTFKPRD